MFSGKIKEMKGALRALSFPSPVRTARLTLFVAVAAAIAAMALAALDLGVERLAGLFF